ncbi:MAG: hypothetical protein CMM46_07035 [Rhodospirillaceae bacterium]|nr:hypothetical protein [Rhodospirillaceae bacterium]
MSGPGVFAMRPAPQFVAFLSFVALAVVVTAQAHETTHNNLYFIHPWIAEPPPGVSTVAGYVVIDNDGDAAERLIAVSAPFAEKAELHSSSFNDEGIMTMREVEQGLEVEAGGSVYLEPGGYHIMLFGVEETLVSGDLHMLTLTFEHAGEAEVEFVIQKRDEPSGHGDAIDDEGGMTMDHDTSMDMDHGDDS